MKKLLSTNFFIPRIPHSPDEAEFIAAAVARNKARGVHFAK